VPDISVVVLAGGKSRRLGTDKALLRLDGEWLLERILSKLAVLTDDLLVVANEEEKLAALHVPVIPDARPGGGSLIGILSGLQAMRYPRGLFVGCDMPFLNLELLRYMILLSTGFDVVIPRIGEELEPLHAVYSKACVLPIGQSLDRGALRVIQFFGDVRVRYIDQQEIDTFDPQHRSFFNINTPDDLEVAARLLVQDKSRARRKPSTRSRIKA
jgi:molybdopterin-guanine dinucleotide biosynthesis protein A